MTSIFVLSPTGTIDQLRAAGYAERLERAQGTGEAKQFSGLQIHDLHVRHTPSIGEAFAEAATGPGIDREILRVTRVGMLRIPPLTDVVDQSAPGVLRIGSN